MSDFITRTARLVPYAKRPKQVPSFVTAYSFEPLPDDPAGVLGNLYVVIEVLVAGRSSEEVADLVIESIGDHYYNGAKDGDQSLNRFEAAIKATNHQLNEYVNDGNAAWIGKLSAIVAVQCGDELHLSQTGSAEAYLYRGKSSTRVAGGGSQRPTSPTKTFGSIASGQLEAGDRILLATPALVHQIALNRLQSVIVDSSPASSIAELTQLLKDGSSERIAALVIEITTAEIAALQVRSEEPDEIQLGSPENAMQAAKMAVSPLAQATIKSSKKVAGHAQSGWQQAQPKLQRSGYKAAGWLRGFLTGKGAVKRLIITAAVIIALVVGFLWLRQSSASVTKLETRYTADYQSYLAAEQLIASGEAQAAQQSLNTLQTELTNLSSEPGRVRLDAKMKKSPIAEGAPTSVSGLQTLVGDKLDQLEGLTKIDPTTVVTFNSIKNAKPTLFELNAGKAYLVDANNGSAIYVVNIATKSLKTTTAKTAGMGTVVATTLSSDGTGMYLLTAKPSVWFYRFDADSLTEQTAGIAGWEAGTSIASYAGNLYILSGSTVYKHVPTYSGFSPKATYLTSAQTAGLDNAKALAVDGNVYILSPTGLRLYLAGVLKATANVPTSLASTTILSSTDSGNTLVGNDATTKRIGFWDAATTLAFSRQYSLNGTKALYSTMYDAKLKTAYSLVDGRMVSFSTK